MADVVVYEDSPLAQYLQDLQTEQPVHELKHAPVPVREPPPPPDSLAKRLADNTCGYLGSLVDYLSEAFSSSSTEKEDAEFEERFKYLICTSPFLNRTATIHAHERGRRIDSNAPPSAIEYSSRFFSPGRFGYSLGFGSFVAFAARSVLGRTRIGRAAWFRPMFVRPMTAGIALATSLWIIRLLRRRRTQRTQHQALRNLQLLVHHCHSIDSRVNRAMMVIQEIELVSRGYRLSTPLAPISRIEQASKTRRCNLVRAQLLNTLDTSSALFQRATQTLQSHIDQNRLNTLLDMYSIVPSHPDSPAHDDETIIDINGPRSPGFGNNDSMNGSHGTLTGDRPHSALGYGQQEPHVIMASPTHDSGSPYQSFFNNATTGSPSHTAGHARGSRNSFSMGTRRRRVSTGAISNYPSRPSSFHEGAHARPRSRPSSFYEGTFAAAMMASNTAHASAPVSATTTTTPRTRQHRHHTSWSSEGEDSDNGQLQLPSMMLSPRSSIYSTYNSPTNASTTMTPQQVRPPSPPGMSSLERLRRNFQRMHGYRREFLCELLSIRRKSRKERQGIHQALKDYDKNWSVAAALLKDGAAELENLVNELTKVLDEELYTLPRIDTNVQTEEDSATGKQIQPFVQRLASMEQCIRGIQAKLYICNEDIKDVVKQESLDSDKKRILEMQFDSISQDISMISSEWQLGKTALARALDPSSATAGSNNGHNINNQDDTDNGFNDHALIEKALDNTDQAIRQVYDALEQLDNPHTLSTTQEEVFEASTDADSLLADKRRAGLGIQNPDGTKMTRAERIAYQKAQREQEELLRERSRVTFRMVDELKNVLGQRRHLREGEPEDPASTTTITTTTTTTTKTTIATTPPATVTSAPAYFAATATATAPPPFKKQPPTLPSVAIAFSESLPPVPSSMLSPTNTMTTTTTLAELADSYSDDDEDMSMGEGPTYYPHQMTNSLFFKEELAPLDQPMEEITAWTTSSPDS